ncbi:hypothetical protein SLA2020_396690 [Shorea laevis]
MGKDIPVDFSSSSFLSLYERGLIEVNTLLGSRICGMLPSIETFAIVASCDPAFPREFSRARSTKASAIDI